MSKARLRKNQYKALKIVYNRNESFEELLLRKNKVSAHQKHLHILATEVFFQSLTDVNPDFWKLYFTATETPNRLQNGIFWKISSALFTRYQQINLEHV